MALPWSIFAVEKKSHISQWPSQEETTKKKSRHTFLRLFQHSELEHTPKRNLYQQAILGDSCHSGGDSGYHPQQYHHHFPYQQTSWPQNKKSRKIHMVIFHPPPFLCSNVFPCEFLQGENCPWVLGPKACINAAMSAIRTWGLIADRGSPSGYPGGVFSLGNREALSSWWLNQPIWKILVKMDHFPK